MARTIAACGSGYREIVTPLCNNKSWSNPCANGRVS
ncbi:hypothetical protein EMIT048CA2_20190 [Pseudomonas chlororaphis]